MHARRLTALSVTVLLLLAVAPDATALRFRFPVDNEGGHAIFSAWVIGVDHDPEPGDSRADCLAYSGLRGFPFCYDDHGGSDFLLDGGFPRMDAGSARILAAADGVVVRVVDGNYDRCHGEVQTFDVTCDGFERHSNYVAIEHAGGWRTEYHHMKKGSPLVAEGDLVRCGEPLGLIGSSGYSSAPHLHFQVFSPAGEDIDPFAGPESQPESFWVEQEGPEGLPAERCEGEPPPPDVVEPDPDAGAADSGSPSDDDVGGAHDAGATGADDAPTVDTDRPPDAEAAKDVPGGAEDRTAAGDGLGGDAGADPWAQTDAGRPSARLPVSCAAAPFGQTNPSAVLLLALLLAVLGWRFASLGGRQSWSRSPRWARVARSASARSRNRRTRSASS